MIARVLVGWSLGERCVLGHIYRDKLYDRECSVDCRCQLARWLAHLGVEHSVVASSSSDSSGYGPDPGVTIGYVDRVCV